MTNVFKPSLIYLRKYIKKIDIYRNDFEVYMGT